MAEHTIQEKTKWMLCKHRFPCNTLTHSSNEDLLNINHFKSLNAPQKVFKQQLLNLEQKLLLKEK
jgi:hypothetical protein